MADGNITVTVDSLTQAMIHALAAIDDELGLLDDGCNSTARTLGALRKLKAEASKSEGRAAVVSANLVAELRHIAERCEFPDGDYVSISLQMWAEDWIRRIEVPNVANDGRP